METHLEKHSFPNVIVWGTLALCLIPLLLNGLGIDFSLITPHRSTLAGLDLKNAHELESLVYQYLSGAFVHTILEWSAFGVASLTVVLAFIHYKLTHNMLTPLIGLTLFLAGCMDAFHILATDFLMTGIADNHNFIPFTWAICRFFNALMMLTGVLLFIIRRKEPEKSDIGFLILSCIYIGSLAFLLVYICATSSYLPQTLFAKTPIFGIITRPYDVIPLLLYLMAGLFIYPAFYRHYPSLFAFSLILSVIPDITVQLYMAIGSTELFDNNFNVAHFLKIVAYLVPFTGLLLDYIKTYQDQSSLVTQLRQEIAERERLEQEVMEISSLEQQRIGKDLHDSLGQKMTGIALLAESLRRGLVDQPDYQTEVQSLKQIVELSNASVSQARSFSKILAPLDLYQQNLTKALTDLASQTSQLFTINCELALSGPLPVLTPEQSRHLYRIIQEATTNGVRHGHAKNIQVQIDCSDRQLCLTIRDDGVGFVAGDESPHSGLGLKLMHYRARALGAILQIEKQATGGTMVYFRMPLYSSEKTGRES